MSWFSMREFAERVGIINPTQINGGIDDPIGPPPAEQLLAWCTCTDVVHARSGLQSAGTDFESAHCRSLVLRRAPLRTLRQSVDRRRLTAGRSRPEASPTALPR